MSCFGALPRSFEINQISVTLLDTETWAEVKLSTDDQGNGTYLHLEVRNNGEAAIALEVAELEAIAAIGRRLVEMVEEANLKAPSPELSPPAMAIIPTAKQEPKT